MRTILLHPDPAIRQNLRTCLNRLDHVVVHEDAHLDHIAQATAKHRPHFIVAATPEPARQRQIIALFQKLALEVPIAWVPPGLPEAVLEEWLVQKNSALAGAIQAPPLARYAEEYRTVWRDEEYAAFDHGEKQNVPRPSPNSAQELAQEMVLFARQVGRATEYQADARRELRQVLLTDKGLRTEIAYRAVHSSIKAYWLRDHIFRFVGVLARFLPGVDCQYLPPAAPPSPRVDYLSHRAVPESYYAATALLGHGFKPSWMHALRAVLDLKFSGQDEVALLHETLLMAGWASLLREIAQAQIRVMAAALDPKASWYTDGLPPRELHRATGIYLDFWHLRHLRVHPEYLRQVANGVVVDGTGTPETLAVVPPFHHFIPTGYAGNAHSQ